VARAKENLGNTNLTMVSRSLSSQPIIKLCMKVEASGAGKERTFASQPGRVSIHEGKQTWLISKNVRWAEQKMVPLRQEHPPVAIHSPGTGLRNYGLR